MGKDVFNLLVMGVVGFAILSVFVMFVGIGQNIVAPPPPPTKGRFFTIEDYQNGRMPGDPDEAVASNQQAPGAFYPGAQPESTGAATTNPLLLAAGAGLAAFGAMGAVGYLLFFVGKQEEQGGEITADSAMPEAQRAENVQVIGASTLEAEPVFDEYGRPMDYEPVQVEGYYRNLVLSVIVASIIGLILCIGPMPLAFMLGMMFE